MSADSEKRLAKMYTLEELAALIAIEAPKRQARYVLTCGVSWDLVNAIRMKLEETGFDWRAAQKSLRKMERET